MTICVTVCNECQFSDKSWRCYSNLHIYRTRLSLPNIYGTQGMEYIMMIKDISNYWNITISDMVGANYCCITSEQKLNNIAIMDDWFLLFIFIKLFIIACNPSKSGTGNLSWECDFLHLPLCLLDCVEHLNELVNVKSCFIISSLQYAHWYFPGESYN